MKLLLDMGLSPRTANFLCAQGHDAEHISLRGMPRITDQQIMTLAENEGRIVVTFALEFSRILAIQRQVKPSVILFRLERFTTDEINSTLADVLQTYATELGNGAIIVVDPHRVRVRALPLW
jgi:predicted nuclease of predicted toxin-antitoxin system